MLCKRLPRPWTVFGFCGSWKQQRVPLQFAASQNFPFRSIKFQLPTADTYTSPAELSSARGSCRDLQRPCFAGGNRCLVSPAFSASTTTLASMRAQCTTRGRTACVVHNKQHAVTCKPTSPQPQSWRRTQQFHRPTPACRAEERSRDSTKTSEAERLKAPDMPPTKDSSRASEVGHEVIADAASKQAELEVQFQVACRKKQVRRKHKLVTSQTSSGLYSKGRGSRSSRLPLLVTFRYFRPSVACFEHQPTLASGHKLTVRIVVQSILQEVRLIEWPTPKQVCCTSCSS